MLSVLIDCPPLTEMVPSSSSSGPAAGVIPLSVEMLTDSDDEDHSDRKPPRHLATSSQTTQQSAGLSHVGGLTAVGSSSNAGDGRSKLLLLKMATEFVERADAAASQKSISHGTSIFKL